MEELDTKIVELNKKVDELEKRVNLLEDINRKNRIKKIIYYCFLLVGSVAVILIARYVFISTYGPIMDYLGR